MLNLEKMKDLNVNEVSQLMKLLKYKDNKYMAQKPLPKQQVCMTLPHKEVLFGGAAGGGKSSYLLMDALQNVDVKGYSAIIFRKTFADLIKPGALIDRAKDWLFRFDDVRWKDKERKFEFLEKYGTKTDVRAVLQFGYLENPNDKYNYQGGEYQFCGFDELTHIDEQSYLYMFSRMRRIKGFTVPLKVRAATNPPADEAGMWVKRRFVDSETKEKDAIFLSSGISDNPYLDQEEYRAMLANLDPVTRRQLENGDWDIVRVGNMFKEEWFHSVPKSALSPYRRKVRFWDMAATDEAEAQQKGRNADYTGGILVSEWQGCYFIEDIEHGRFSPSENMRLQRQLAQTDGFSTVIREEQEPGSAAKTLIHTKKRDLFQGYRYEGIKSTGSKIKRAEMASKLCEERKIYFVEGCRNINKLLDELCTFPIGTHDDLADAFSGAINYLHNNNKIILPMDIGGSLGNSYWTDSTMTTLGNGGFSGGYFGNI